MPINMQHVKLSDITATGSTSIPNPNAYKIHEVDLRADSGAWTIKLQRREVSAADYKDVTGTLILDAGESGSLSCGPGGDIVINAVEDSAGTLEADVVSHGGGL